VTSGNRYALRNPTRSCILDERPLPRRTRFRALVPRFRLRTLLLAVLVVAVLIRVGLWGWPRYVLYRQGREYAELQATKQAFVESLRMRRSSNLPSASLDDSRPVPDGFIILVRRGDTFGCFIPRNQGAKGESLEYDWYYRSDGKGSLNPDDPNVHSGHAFAGPYVLGAGLVRVTFGPFDMELSGSDPGWGYVYYQHRNSAKKSDGTRDYETLSDDHLRFCSTDAKSVVLVDARDARWIYRAYNGDEGVPGNVDISPQHEAIEQRDQKTVNEY
jgi:hypothetical protein